MDRVEELRGKEEKEGLTNEELDELIMLEELENDIGVHQTQWGCM